MSLMELQNLSVGYGKREILQNISLSFAEQEIVCLLGANGCGKTTLLKTILGLLAPKKGQILFQQSPFMQRSKKERAQLIGYVPQAQHIFSFSVLDVVLMGRNARLAWYQTPTKQDKEIAEKALEMLGIAHLSTRQFDQISGGERQMALIARALTQQPKMLIMDEPTSNLDFGNQLRVLETIRQLKSQTGLSIIMTTHQPEHSWHVAERNILFFQGQVFTQGTPKETLSAENLAKIYQLTPEVVAQHFMLKE